jgi:DNA-directed RNA polymerase specialized sigma24 family protein
VPHQILPVDACEDPALLVGSAEAMNRAYAVAYRMTGSAADAEAATREALLQICREFDPPPGKPGDPARLYRLTVNAVLAFRRSGVTDRGRPTAAEAPDGDRHARLEAAIAALPPTYRDPFVLADVERLSADAVGDLLRLTVTEVTSRLHRARLILCAALRDIG